MKTTVLNGQSLLDVALQYGGTVETAFEIARTNGISITANLVTGQQIDVPATPQKTAIVSYYNRNKITPATAADDDDSTITVRYVEDNYVNKNYIENG